MNRNVDQPYKYDGTWAIDEWSKIGLHVSQRVVPTGPWFEAMRSGNFDVVLEGNCNNVPNPLLDVQKYLPGSVFTDNYGNYDDQPEVDLYQRMLHETDTAKQRALMRQFEKYVLGDQAHEIFLLWWYRRTAPMSKAGRSARAIISTRTWGPSGSTDSEQGSAAGSRLG